MGDGYGKGELRLVPKFEKKGKDILDGGSPYHLRFDVHPIKLWIITATQCNSVHVWNYEDGTRVASWVIPDVTNADGVAFIAQKDWILVRRWKRFEVCETQGSNLRCIKVLTTESDDKLSFQMAIHPTLPCLLASFEGKELQVATENFDAKWKLEHGDQHERVYRGKLNDDTLVMVKKVILDASMQGVHHDTMKSKVVDRLRLLRHPHILTLLGVCYEESCLVYEYMARGTVKDWISCARQSTWYARFRVMAEVARGLCFLHSDPLGTGGPIIHSAIRPATIFLDDRFVAKLGGVDRALLNSEFPEGVEKTLNRTSQLFAQQNSHYIAPEYWQSRAFSEKTDVFAFGITLLEMLTGNFTNAFEVVEDAIEDDDAFENALDPSAGCWNIVLAH
ncbi:hypothetical protein CBR_g50906 [Chara braunii]|uniref:Protein kinase domain-containing protein n=1 Tax=Chara braunii TaxID=69332 RepID=A0A388M7V0_CHABU|nr:hypothetical protein CBR_g50906 [Chara braunii]|eukprot:GBG90563.1 hypothetical protein CBR_g50906 [Chara braunii]